MCLCTNACTCVYFCLVHVHVHTTDHTTPHHPLIHQIYRQWCAFTRRYMECGQHHHFTEQSDLNGLLHLCQSLQDVHVCTLVNGTQYYMCLVFVMCPHVSPTPPQLCSPHAIMHLGVGGGEGTQMMKYMH